MRTVEEILTYIEQMQLNEHRHQLNAETRDEAITHMYASNVLYLLKTWIEEANEKKHALNKRLNDIIEKRIQQYDMGKENADNTSPDIVGITNNVLIDILMKTRAAGKK